MKKETKVSPERIRFKERFGDLNDSDTLKEILFAQHLQFEKLEKIRSNTSVLVWWLIAVPLIVGMILLFMGVK